MGNIKQKLQLRVSVGKVLRNIARKKRHAETYLFWWARRDLNPHVRSEH